jgi:hypothetical protein
MKISQPKENERLITLITGNVVRIRREDPYGYWYVSYEKGPIPKGLEGAFTTVNMAIRMVQRFLASGDTKLEAGDAVPKAAPPKTKHVSANAKAKAEALRA